MSSPWLVSWPGATASPGRPALLCLPQAGAGCRQFGPWATVLAGRARLLGVALPARESRWADQQPRTVDGLVQELADAVADELPTPTPLVLFGHSLGGLLAYELARRLQERYRPVAGLVVAACRPPGSWSGAGRGLEQDDEALSALLSGRGIDDELDEDTRELLLDVLRYDARLTTDYVHAAEPALHCPLWAWGGADDVTVAPHELDGWTEVTTGPSTRRTFAGGHDFPLQQASAVLDELLDLLATCEPHRRLAHAPAGGPPCLST